MGMSRSMLVCVGSSAHVIPPIACREVGRYVSMNLSGRISVSAGRITVFGLRPALTGLSARASHCTVKWAVMCIARIWPWPTTSSFGSAQS